MWTRDRKGRFPYVEFAKESFHRGINLFFFLVLHLCSGATSPFSPQEFVDEWTLLSRLWTNTRFAFCRVESDGDSAYITRASFTGSYDRMPWFNLASWTRADLPRYSTMLREQHYEATRRARDPSAAKRNFVFSCYPLAIFLRERTERPFRPRTNFR